MCVCVYQCVRVSVCISLCVCVCVCVLTDRTEESMVIPLFSSLKLPKIITPYGLIDIFPFSTHVCVCVCVCVCVYAILCKTSFNWRVGAPSAPKLGQLDHFQATARKHLLMTDLGGVQRIVTLMLFRSSYDVFRCSI